ncbi:lactonase family protein [Gemmata sp.]|uniref:lactonase family protein n=1 Tax=Gemmata sp. TaxID=1914242 RepID=UPI003F71E616
MTLTRAAAVAVALAFAGTAAADDSWVFFGTYTDKAGSKGIYRAKFDAKTGKLSEPELAAEMGSPSFLAVHPSNKFLYAVGEGGGKDGGPVVAYSVDAKTGALTKLNELLSGGSGPCHVSIHPKGTHAIVANYGGGSTAFYKLGDDGKLVERIAFFQHEGSGANPGRQKEPHSHCGFFTPNGAAAVSVDLGIDRVKVFTLDAAKNTVTEAKDQDVTTPPGAGPRHIAIAPDGKFAYVCGELDSTVNVIEFGEKGGKVVQSLSTLKEPVKGNSTAECVLSPDGKFVYVSNRGANTIAAFKVGEDRKLTVAGHVTGDIKIPRNFNIDPSGKWMLIASQDGGKVGVWEIDAVTGLAKETGTTVPVSKCVCVKFVPLAK